MEGKERAPERKGRGQEEREARGGTGPLSKIPGSALPNFVRAKYTFCRPSNIS